MSTPRSIPAKVPRRRPLTQQQTPTAGRGRATTTRRRHRKVLKDTVQGITKGDLRRLARRGGVKRMSAGIYDEARLAMKDFLREVIGDAVACVELKRSQTMAYTDVIYALKRRGRTLYGFGPDYDRKKQHHNHHKSNHARRN